MGRGLDGFFCDTRVALCSFEGPGEAVSRPFPVALARGKHLFPFRTEKLSPSAPMVLGPRGPGRVGRRRFFYAGRLRAARRGSGESRARPRRRLPCASRERDSAYLGRRCGLPRASPSTLSCCFSTQRRPTHGRAREWLVLV